MFWQIPFKSTDSKLSFFVILWGEPSYVTGGKNLLNLPAAELFLSMYLHKWLGSGWQMANGWHMTEQKLV